MAKYGESNGNIGFDLGSWKVPLIQFGHSDLKV